LEILAILAAFREPLRSGAIAALVADRVALGGGIGRRRLGATRGESWPSNPSSKAERLLAFEAVAGEAEAFANFFDVLEAVRFEH